MISTFGDTTTGPGVFPRIWRRLIVIVITSVLFVVAGASSSSAQSGEKMSIGILIDNTGSMRLQLEYQGEIAKAVLKNADPVSPISLFAFAESRQPAPLTSAKFAAGAQCSTDRQVLNAQIGNIATVPGQTVLRDAIQSAVQIMHNPGGRECQVETRILVIMTDGEDRASAISTDELIAFVKARKVKLYVIGLFRDMRRDSGFLPKSPFEKSKDFLVKLANETGGRIVFPKDGASAEKIVTEIFSEGYVFAK